MRTNPFRVPKGQLPVSLAPFPVPLRISDTKSPQGDFLNSGRSCPDSARTRCAPAHTRSGFSNLQGGVGTAPHPHPHPHGVPHSLLLAPPSRAFLTQAPGESKSHSLAFPGMWCWRLLLLFSLMLTSLGSVGRSGAGEWGRWARAPLEGSQLGSVGCRM